MNMEGDERATPKGRLGSKGEPRSGGKRKAVDEAQPSVASFFKKAQSAETPKPEKRRSTLEEWDQEWATGTEGMVWEKTGGKSSKDKEGCGEGGDVGMSAGAGIGEVAVQGEGHHADGAALADTEGGGNAASRDEGSIGVKCAQHGEGSKNEAELREELALGDAPAAGAAGAAGAAAEVGVLSGGWARPVGVGAEAGGTTAGATGGQRCEKSGSINVEAMFFGGGIGGGEDKGGEGGGEGDERGAGGEGVSGKMVHDGANDNVRNGSAASTGSNRKAGVGRGGAFASVGAVDERQVSDARGSDDTKAGGGGEEGGIGGAGVAETTGGGVDAGSGVAADGGGGGGDGGGGGIGSHNLNYFLDVWDGDHVMLPCSSHNVYQGQKWFSTPYP